MDIATWAREYFGKSLSLNTVRCCINKWLKMYYAKRKAFINFAQKRCQILWAQNNLKWTERQWKRVLWSDESTFKFVFGKNGHQILHGIDEKRHTVTNEKCKKQSLRWYGGASVPTAWYTYLHICEGTIDAEAYVGNLERHAAVKTTTFPRNSMSISAGQCHASFCTRYNSMAS